MKHCILINMQCFQIIFHFLSLHCSDHHPLYQILLESEIDDNNDPITQKVGQKYFKGDAVLQGGATLGIQNFREAKRCILMINDSHKAGILYQIMQANQSDPAIPATAILEFENASLYCDRAAASKWTAH